MATLISSNEVKNVVLAGGIGPPGPPGPPGVRAVFILDVIPITNGVVGDKVLSSDSKRVISCAADLSTVQVLVGCEGGNDEYTPTCIVKGIPVTFVESTTKRWFTGTVTIPLDLGPNTVTAITGLGAETSVNITRLGLGPAITSIDIGNYPGTQTQLKAGDVLPITVYTEIEATEVSIISSSTANATVIPISGGTGSGNITIGNGTGSVTFQAKAKNSFGTYGATFTSPSITLNQTYPSFSAFTITYPAGQLALKQGESADVTCTSTNSDTSQYLGTGVSISNPSSYTVTNTVTATSADYVASGTNYTITSTRAANNATASASTLVKLATAAPTAQISITTAYSRLPSSPGGLDYEVVITPSQALINAPTLNTSAGAWQGSWTASGTQWKRYLRISDAVARGVATFSSLTLTSISYVSGNAITAGSTFTVGGISSRILTVPAFSKVTYIGTYVSNYSKTVCSILAGATLVRQNNDSYAVNGFYISDADGTYNESGNYLALSNTDLTNSNTSGTLQVQFEEVP